MFRLIALVIMLVFGVGSVLAVDYAVARYSAAPAEREHMTPATYLTDLSGRLAGLVVDRRSAPAGLPTALADMLPKPPEGWTVRPAQEEDLQFFVLTKRRSAPDKDSLALVATILQRPAGPGTDSAAVLYEKGNSRVIFQLVRHPDRIFTDPAAIDQRIALRQTGAHFTATQFMTLRGLDLGEDLLPKGFRARLFFANVAGQIQLRVLASHRMADEDLLPLFRTLHVAAMNAAVVDRRPGLGEVPVIVLASALDPDTRAAYEAELATRAAEREALNAADREKAATAAPQAPEPQELGFLDSLFGPAPQPAAATAPAADGVEPAQVVCATGSDGSKKCTVGSAAGQN